MKQMYLTSSVEFVASSIGERIGAAGKRLAFVSTAAEVVEDDLTWLNRGRDALVDTGFDVEDYTLTGNMREEIERDLLDFDAIFFSGGNNFYLMEKIQESGSAPTLRKLVEEGKIYIGESAGSTIASSNIYATYMEEDMEAAPNLRGFEGLGLVDFLVFPHWGSEDFRDRYIGHRMDHAYTSNDRIILLTDYQYVMVQGEMMRIIDVLRD
ncbi:MAG: type 1 glutamine amidotransferase-like domain-containing protein [Methanomassiliicoccales archaeon]|nr:type 1 glutamine amidotransferase-like domain-containing protein [Methanomassiliicoccales archaeon]